MAGRHFGIVDREYGSATFAFAPFSQVAALDGVDLAALPSRAVDRDRSRVSAALGVCRAVTRRMGAAPPGVGFHRRCLSKRRVRAPGWLTDEALAGGNGLSGAGADNGVGGCSTVDPPHHDARPRRRGSHEFDFFGLWR